MECLPSCRRVGGVVSWAVGFLLLLAGSAVSAEFTIIHTFTNGSADGSWPSGRLGIDENGTLYGTTARGGSACPTASYSCGGTVYRLSRPKKGSTEWRHKVIATFKGGTDGSYPLGGVTYTEGAVLYGGTTYGGRLDCAFEPHHWGCGTLFRLTPPAAGETKWQKDVLHRFYKEKDGRFPYLPPIVFGFANQLYGFTTRGGTADAGVPYEIILTGSGGALAPAKSTPGSTPPDWRFEPDPFPPYLGYGLWYYSTVGGLPVGWDACQAGDTFVITDLSQFKGICAHPSTSLLSSRSDPIHGSFYGSTSSGGDDNCVDSGNQGCGLVFQIRQKSSGEYSYNVLYNFVGGPDGYWPNGKLVIGPDGSLYGTTLWGGTSCALEPIPGRGCGTVFKLTPPKDSTGGWTETILHRFAGGVDGALPAGGVVLGPDGSLYGATTNGGGCTYSTRGCGTIFKLTPPVTPATRWRETVVHSFQNQSDGMAPDGPLTSDAKGHIYGTALNIVFQITP